MNNDTEHCECVGGCADVIATRQHSSLLNINRRFKGDSRLPRVGYYLTLRLVCLGILCLLWQHVSHIMAALHGFSRL